MNPHPKKRGWAWLGVLTWNTHMGKSLTPQMWAEIRRVVPRLHVVMLQEVDDPRELQRVLGEKWFIAPVFRADDNRGTTYVAVKRGRFTAIAVTVKNVRYGSKHSRQVVSVDGIDKKTGRATLLVCLHPDPLGAGFNDADFRARRRHERQVQAVATHVFQWDTEWHTEQPVAIVAGDGNEVLTQQVKPSLKGRDITARFKQVGLRAAWTFRPEAHRKRVRLDDVWIRGKGVSLIRRIQWRPGNHVPGAAHLDHDLVFALLSIRKRGTL